MKSVTIRDKDGNLLIRITHGKKEYFVIKDEKLQDLDIEIRDDENKKVFLRSVLG